MTQMESYWFHDRGRSVTKSILIISHFRTCSLISWSSPSGLMCSTFTCWQTKHLDSKSSTSHLILLHQYISYRLFYIFVKPGWIVYFDSWASSKILPSNPSTLGTHNLYWYLKIPSPPITKSTTFYWTILPLIFIKLGYNTCFSFISTTRDVWDTKSINTPPSIS